MTYLMHSPIFKSFSETSGESKLNGNINFKFGEIDFKIQITEYEKNKKITWECVDTSLRH